MINPTSIQLLDGARWNHFATADLCVFFQSPAFLGFGATTRGKLVSQAGGYWARGMVLVKCKKVLSSNSSMTVYVFWDKLEHGAGCKHRDQWQGTFGFIGKLLWHTSEAQYQDFTQPYSTRLIILKYGAMTYLPGRSWATICKPSNALMPKAKALRHCAPPFFSVR